MALQAVGSFSMCMWLLDLDQFPWVSLDISKLPVLSGTVAGVVKYPRHLGVI